MVFVTWFDFYACALLLRCQGGGGEFQLWWQVEEWAEVGRCIICLNMIGPVSLTISLGESFVANNAVWDGGCTAGSYHLRDETIIVLLYISDWSGANNTDEEDDEEEDHLSQHDWPYFPNDASPCFAVECFLANCDVHDNHDHNNDPKSLFYERPQLYLKPV